MSGMYGRQELPAEPGSRPDEYLRLLDRRRHSRQLTTEGPMRYSDLRWRLFSLMASNPEAEWTAKALEAALAADSVPDPQVVDAGTDTIHGIMTALMADLWVEPVPFQQLLTVRLTHAGRLHLRELLLTWTVESRAGEENA
jgi:hypothetical protein